MIKKFEITDLGSFLPNKFSNPDVVLDQLTDPAFEVETLWHGGMVMAILAYRNYWNRNWLGFFLISEDFPGHLAIRLRNHIRETMERKDALRLQTDSVADPCLDKWHKLLGFKLEGTREKMLFDQDYNCWARMRVGV